MEQKPPDLAMEGLDGDSSSLISLTTLPKTRGLESFGQKITTTASHLMGPSSEITVSNHYQMAMSEVHKQLQRPGVQNGLFGMARNGPAELVRSKLSKREIQHRALTFVPDELLATIPPVDHAYSLFQGFEASFPEMTPQGKLHRRSPSRGRMLLEETASDGKSAASQDPLSSLHKYKREKAALLHELEMLSIRKHMAASEVRDIDNKIANLAGMRRLVLGRLSRFEQEETVLEQDLMDVETRLDEGERLAQSQKEVKNDTHEDTAEDDQATGSSSKSIYRKPSTPKAKANAATDSTAHVKPQESNTVRPRIRSQSLSVLHESYEPGMVIREIRAHRDTITSLDFDVPFGTMVTAAMDDTVRVWDLNAGRCIGLLDGHTASVRALQVEDSILATASRDATIRLWDLSRAHYDPHGHQFGDEDDDDKLLAFASSSDQPIEPPEGTMDDCPLYTLSGHMDAVTALHFHGDVMVSGSADKTIRHWDLQKGRCVQTLDVMWAAAQASTLGTATDLGFRGNKVSSSSSTTASTTTGWRSMTRSTEDSWDFVGALQVFESALACGTADGMVRLWDLRSGQVSRSLVGHTGPVTCLQFDDTHLVTGSLDRSIRIWDLRTGALHDAYAYSHPVTSMMFDARRIVSAAGENVVKVYDKVEGRQWDCGAGAGARDGKKPADVQQVRVRDGYLVEGRADGIVGIWTC